MRTPSERRMVLSGLVLALGLACVVSSTPAAASAQQAGLLLDVRGGVAVPVGSFADGGGPGEGAEAGPSLAVAFLLPRSDSRAIYLGFSQHRFGCVPAGCPQAEPYVATGFAVGMRFTALASRDVSPWLALGGITTRVETHGLAAPDAGVSKLGFGGEAALGVRISTGGSVAIGPSLTASTVGSELPGGAKLTLRHLTAALGITISF